MPLFTIPMAHALFVLQLMSRRASGAMAWKYKAQTLAPIRLKPGNVTVDGWDIHQVPVLNTYFEVH
jgi:hypothetical protein